jgi:ABC-type antimicrobial peptide transport system permease subunit
VGVVSDLPAQPLDPAMVQARVYRAAQPGEMYPVTLLVKTESAVPAGLAARLRTQVQAVEPTLRIEELVPLDTYYHTEQFGLRWTAIVIGLVGMSVILLSAAGVYALLSFTVARRRREIGLRSALGAQPRQIVLAMLSRALTQVGFGIIAGVLAAGLLDAASGQQLLGGHAAMVLPLVAGMMAVVGMLASIGPARKGLQVSPLEALRDG